VPKTPGDKKPQMANIIDIRCNIIPGEYTVSIKIGDKEHKSNLKVLPDPRFQLNPAELQNQYQVLAELLSINNLYARAVTQPEIYTETLKKPLVKFRR